VLHIILVTLNDLKKENMMNWEEKEKIENAAKKSEAYKDENGVWRWKSNNRVPFKEMLECWNLSDEEIEVSLKAKNVDYKASIKEYREAMKNHQPSREELFEIRAAFGVWNRTGKKLVNVITGKTIQL
jgi:hypothetical protein